MVVEDGKAQVETQGTRGDEKAVQFGADPNGREGTRRTGSQARGEPFAIDRNDRTRRDFINQYGQATLGGILDRLISKVTNEIAELEGRLVDRQDYLKELRELSSQLSETSEQT